MMRSFLSSFRQVLPGIGMCLLFAFGFMTALSTEAQAQQRSTFNQLHTGELEDVSRAGTLYMGLTGSSSQPQITFIVDPSSRTNRTRRDAELVLNARYRKNGGTKCFEAQISGNQFSQRLTYWNGAVLKVCTKIDKGKPVRWVQLKARKDKRLRFTTY